MGTAYAIWVGVGASVTAIWSGIEGEPFGPAKIAFLALIMVGVIGLELSRGKGTDPTGASAAEGSATDGSGSPAGASAADGSGAPAGPSRRKTQPSAAQPRGDPDPDPAEASASEYNLVHSSARVDQVALTRCERMDGWRSPTRRDAARATTSAPQWLARKAPRVYWAG